MISPAREPRPEASRGMIQPTELVLSGWPRTDAEWSRLIDDNSIPPATVRRAVVLDFADPLLDQLVLPSATIAADGESAEPHPEVVTLRDQTCPGCDRAVVVVYKPWGLEPLRAIVDDVRGWLEAIAWHDRHPRE
jgi:hypothetical protein